MTFRNRDHELKEWLEKAEKYLSRVVKESGTNDPDTRDKDLDRQCKKALVHVARAQSLVQVPTPQGISITIARPDPHPKYTTFPAELMGGYWRHRKKRKSGDVWEDPRLVIEDDKGPYACSSLFIPTHVLGRVNWAGVFHWTAHERFKGCPEGSIFKYRNKHYRKMTWEELMGYTPEDFHFHQEGLTL